MVAFIRTGRGAGGWLLLSLAACGGRTGELDGYQPDTGSSLPSHDGTSAGGQGATSGSSSNGASTSTGASTSAGASTSTGAGTSTGGAASAGQAGAPSKGGAPGTAGSAGSSGDFGQAGAATGGSAGTGGSLTVACSELCLDPQTACPGQFGPPDQCWNDCVNALSVQNGACEPVGFDLVRCVKSVARKYGQDCSTGASQAPVQCAGLVEGYQACASANGGPTPVPAPLSCMGGGSAAPGKCYQNQTCSDGRYFNVACYEQGPNQSACTCMTGNATSAVTANITLNESATYACNDALVACNGPNLPK